MDEVKDLAESLSSLKLEPDGIAEGDRSTKNFELQSLQLVTYRDNYCVKPVSIAVDTTKILDNRKGEEQMVCRKS
jgi:hypothetical protein